MYTTVDSPIGELMLVGEGEVLSGLYMQDAPRPMPVRSEWRREDDAFPEVRSELDEYFAGERTDFGVALEMKGTPFQRRCGVPSGRSRTARRAATESWRAASATPPPYARWAWPTGATRSP